MKYYRQIIKIGNSFGVTIPCRDTKIFDLNKGDWVEITIKKVR